MTIHTYPDYDAMSKAVADMVAALVKQKPDAVISFPSGDTPAGLLAYLVKYAQQGKVNFSETRFVALDEWTGMDEHNEGSCAYFLNEHFYTPLNIPAERKTLFNARATDLDAECLRMNEHVKQLGGLDMMIVGIGMNGHIGLNEPGANFNGYANHSGLDGTTVNVAQKYFKEQTNLTGGITLGLKHLAEAKAPVLIASGTKKSPIITQALEGDVSNSIPASVFQTLPHAHVFLDRAAAASLKQG